MENCLKYIKSEYKDSSHLIPYSCVIEDNFEKVRGPLGKKVEGISANTCNREKIVDGQGRG